MTQEARIRRSATEAREALARLSLSTDIVEQQRAWEVFLSAWRRSLNQVSAHYRNNSMDKLADEMHHERIFDPLLDYVWEARNTEEHTADGTSAPALRRVQGALHVNGHDLLVNGRHLLIGMNETVLEFRDLQVVRAKRKVTLTAPTLPPKDVANYAMEFLSRSLSSLG
ncbi:hypothetical protein [Rhizobium sp. RU36D]|uniref:hypothetical protein n=1 Tax=Rhizobium sp. RU36D TaxID=1907415 RepID=UPI00117B3787|nr:hypothetical protein [Rhizobium sp. RU36D]